MGNLNCSNSTLDNQTEIKSADINRDNSYISKNNFLKINLSRTMIKSKTCPPTNKLSLKEKNHIFLDKIKNLETKKDKKNRHSFTPSRSNQFKISEEYKKNFDNESIQKNNIRKNKLINDNKNEKENEKDEDNDKNKKGTILKKGKSSPLEVICEQIEDEKKVLDTTRTFKNKEIIANSNSKNINDKNNDINNINENNKENNNNLNNYNENKDLNLMNDSSYFSNDNINENNNKENSGIEKNEVKLQLFFNHTGSSKGEEEFIQEQNFINFNNDNNINNYYYNNINDNFENKDIKKNNYIKEQYKDLYKRKPYKNKYHKEINWRDIKIDPNIMIKNENHILLQGEFLVFKNILDINSFTKSNYSRYLTLTKHEINIFRSKEKYIYNSNPLINISLFNISKCDILSKNDVNLFNNLKKLLLKYSLYIKLTTVDGMIILEPSNSSNKKYRFSNPFLKLNYNKPKSQNKYTKKPKDIGLIQQNNEKDKNNNNNMINNKNEKTKNNEINNHNSQKNINKSGFYIIISSDDCPLLLNLVAIINYLRK